MQALSQEFKLVAACSIWPPSERRNDAIRGLARAPLEWDRLLRIVRRQRVDALVHDGLKRAGVTVPEAARLVLQAQALRVPHRNLRFLTEMVRLQQLFAAWKIPVRFVKGVTLAQLVYGGLAIRHCRDIDFLVAPEHASAAVRRLWEAGYAGEGLTAECSDAEITDWIATTNQCQLIDPETGSYIELHWSLVDSPHLIRGAFPLTYRPVLVADKHGFQTLADEELFLYLCVHGSGHCWSRLKWLADIGALLEGRNSDQIKSIYQYAISRGADRCVGLAFILCHGIFGTFIPEELLSSLREQTSLRILEQLALATMAGVGEETELDMRPFGRVRAFLAQLLLGRGLSHAGWSVRNAVTIPMAISPLPKRFHFLYPLVRIPLWIHRQAKDRGRNRYQPAALKP